MATYLDDFTPRGPAGKHYPDAVAVATTFYHNAAIADPRYVRALQTHVPGLINGAARAAISVAALVMAAVFSVPKIPAAMAVTVSIVPAAMAVAVSIVPATMSISEMPVVPVVSDGYGVVAITQI